MFSDIYCKKNIDMKWLENESLKKYNEFEENLLDSYRHYILHFSILFSELDNPTEMFRLINRLILINHTLRYLFF